MGSTSGWGTLTAVVPRMATLRPGTTMSPSPGLWQRLMAACARRRERMTMTPLTAATRLLNRKALEGNSGFPASLDESWLPGLVLLRHGDKVAAGIFDRGPRDAAQDASFLDALDGGGQVVDAVASARVQQPVRAPGGTGCEVALFDKDRIDAAHRQVAEHPGARGPTPDDDNARAGVRH